MSSITETSAPLHSITDTSGSRAQHAADTLERPRDEELGVVPWLEDDQVATPAPPCARNVGLVTGLVAPAPGDAKQPARWRGFADAATTVVDTVTENPWRAALVVSVGAVVAIQWPMAMLAATGATGIVSTAKMLELEVRALVAADPMLGDALRYAAGQQAFTGLVSIPLRR